MLLCTYGLRVFPRSERTMLSPSSFAWRTACCAFGGQYSPSCVRSGMAALSPAVKARTMPSIVRYSVPLTRPFSSRGRSLRRTTAAAVPVQGQVAPPPGGRGLDAGAPHEGARLGAAAVRQLDPPVHRGLEQRVHLHVDAAAAELLRGPPAHVGADLGQDAVGGLDE